MYRKSIWIILLIICTVFRLQQYAFASPLLGDVNGDGKIDALDFSAFVSCYGVKASSPSCTNKEGADLNLDGVIDGIDYNIFLRAFISYTQLQSTITPIASITGTPTDSITSSILSPTTAVIDSITPAGVSQIAPIASPTSSVSPLVQTLICSSTENKKCSFTASCSSNGTKCGCKVPNFDQDRIYQCISGKWSYQSNTYTMSCTQNCND